MWAIFYSMASLPLGTSSSHRERKEKSLASHRGLLSLRRPTLSPRLTPNSLSAEARVFVFSLKGYMWWERKHLFRSFPNGDSSKGFPSPSFNHLYYCPIHGYIILHFYILCRVIKPSIELFTCKKFMDAPKWNVHKIHQELQSVLPESDGSLCSGQSGNWNSEG